jgi:hypothetical protein
MLKLVINNSDTLLKRTTDILITQQEKLAGSNGIEQEDIIKLIEVLENAKEKLTNACDILAVENINGFMELYQFVNTNYESENKKELLEGICERMKWLGINRKYDVVRNFEKIMDGYNKLGEKSEEIQNILGNVKNY